MTCCNPISHIEFDGHIAIPDGNGGGSGRPAPPPPPAPPSPGRAEQLLGTFGEPGRAVGRDLDDLDRRTVHNPDWVLQPVYQASNAIETNVENCIAGDLNDCKNIETGVEDIVGVTDANKCFTEGDRASCGWTAAAGLPFGLGKLKKIFRGLGAVDEVAGPYGVVSRTVLEKAAAGGGPTTRVVTNLPGPPTPGRALSVATGDNPDALAAQARTQGTVYTAQVPNALLWEVEWVGLAQRKTLEMGGVIGTEIRFVPQATEFVTRFFSG